jgi:hypothetical protein
LHAIWGWADDLPALPHHASYRLPAIGKSCFYQLQIPTGFSNVPCFFGVLKNTQFTLYLELILVHEHLHNPKI